MSVYTLPDPEPGAALHEAAETAYRVARLTGCTIRVMFNDFPLLVSRDDVDGATACAAYRKERS